MSESFESAMTYAQAVIADCDIPLLDLLQRAYYHDLEQAKKAEYHRGYTDGKRSMDADHEAAASRLRSLTFDGGSHDNLSRIAYAIYPCATGWTCESARGLRDELVRLIGGVHDGGGDTDSGGDVLPSDGADTDVVEVGEVTPTITSELRDCVYTATKTYDDTLWYEMGEDSEADHTICYITEGELLRVADSIDEWFKRLCEQQEAVMQSTIDEMVEERDELQKRLDEMREQREHWANEATKMYRLFFSHDEYCVPDSPSEMVAVAVRQLQEKCSDAEAFARRIKDAVDKREDVTLFGVDYTPEAVAANLRAMNEELCEEITNLKRQLETLLKENQSLERGLTTDNKVSEYYQQLRRWMGEAKNLHDVLKVRLDSMPHMVKERDGWRKKANRLESECEMYRAMLNDAAREYRELLNRCLGELWKTWEPMTDENMLKHGWVRLSNDAEEVKHGSDGGHCCAHSHGRDNRDGERGRVTVYDVLSNERHKAVCRLREWSPDEDGMSHRELWEAVMGEELPTVPLKGDAELDIILRERLIYLLGGDEPTAMEYIQHIVREHDRKFLNMELSGAELSQASVEAMSRRADQSHKSSPMSQENETGITYKLREYVSATWDGGIYQYEIPKALRAIADRIDRAHQDAMQSVHDSMEAECNKLQAECDRLTAALDELHADPTNDAICRLERENDDLRARLGAIREAFDGKC